jgi:hypothetical protein
MAAPDTALAEGRFVTGGGFIYGPDGRPFVAIGANVGSNNTFDWRGNAKTHAVDASAWGWNCVRLNVMASNEISWSYLASNAGAGLAGMISYLGTIVAEYTARKIVVMIGPHDDPKSSGFVQATVEGHMVDFWTAAAAAWKNNPYVWYNPINEPRYTNAEWVALHDTFATAIRGQGALGPIVCDAPGWGQDAGYLAPYFTDSKYAYESDMAPTLQATHGNILISCHNYGAKHDTVTKVANWINNTRAAGLVPIFGELGYTIDGSSTAGSYAANHDAALLSLDAARMFGVGVLAWHGTHGDNYSLKTNGAAFYYGGASFSLSDFGQRLRALSAPASTAARFGGTSRRL